LKCIGKEKADKFSTDTPPLDYERKVRTTEHRRLKNEKEKGTMEDD